MFLLNRSIGPELLDMRYHVYLSRKKCFENHWLSWDGSARVFPRVSCVCVCVQIVHGMSVHIYICMYGCTYVSMHLYDLYLRNTVHTYVCRYFLNEFTRSFTSISVAFFHIFRRARFLQPFFYTDHVVLYNHFDGL